MGPTISTSVILDTLRELTANVSVPLWLFGGVAVDFLVGRWTRPHSDIDLNTFSAFREPLTVELGKIGYQTADTGWLTHWRQSGTTRRIEIVFLEPLEDGSAELRIPQNDVVGTAGHYRMLPGYMDPQRIASLDGVSFRVCSPEGEWLARQTSVVTGRVRDSKIDHDCELLETLIPEQDLARLRNSVSSR